MPLPTRSSTGECHGACSEGTTGWRPVKIREFIPHNSRPRSTDAFNPAKPATCRARSPSTRGFWGCAYPMRPAASSRSSMASMAVIITSSPSQIRRPGLPPLQQGRRIGQRHWRGCGPDGRQRLHCRLGADTLSAPTTSITSTIPGAATANILAISTTCRRTRTGDGQSHGVGNSLYLWGPEPPLDFPFNYEANPEAQLVARRH
jgi:hypothetical protein